MKEKPTSEDSADVHIGKRYIDMKLLFLTDAFQNIFRALANDRQGSRRHCHPFFF